MYFYRKENNNYDTSMTKGNNVYLIAKAVQDLTLNVAMDVVPQYTSILANMEALKQRA